MKKTNRFREMTLISFFIAIIFTLSLTPFGFIPIGIVKATIVHIPVIIGSIIFGPVAGGILGFCFGLSSLLVNTFMPTITSFVFSPFYSFGEISGNLYSLLVCFIPRIFVGIFPWYLSCILSKLKLRNNIKYYIIGFFSSMINTLLVIIMIIIFFIDDYAMVNNMSVSGVFGFLIGIISINGIIEAVISSIIVSILSPFLIKFHGIK
ncbi:MAG: ECF transporter S component [Oscillospiraceae bacterium]|nr:ECF transporter S component [Oscillospiraceae bacterium]